jgi:hypothetical protein
MPMAMKPNYRHARGERDRAKEQKKQEKLRRREEEAQQRRVERGEAPETDGAATTDSETAPPVDKL